MRLVIGPTSSDGSPATKERTDAFAFAAATANTSNGGSEATREPAAASLLHPQSAVSEAGASRSKTDASSLRPECAPAVTAALPSDKAAHSAATPLAASAASAAATASTSATSAATAASAASVANASAPPAHWAERLANRYGAAAFVSKNLLSLLTRAALFGVLCAGGTAADALTAWMRERALIDSVIVKQVCVHACCFCS